MSSASLSGLLPPDSVECATARSVGLELNGLEERFASSSGLRSLAAAAEIRDVSSSRARPRQMQILASQAAAWEAGPVCAHFRAVERQKLLV